MKTTLPLLALLGFTLASPAATIDLAVNGGFETGDTTGWDYFPTPNSSFTVVPDPSVGSFGAEIVNLTEATAVVIKQSNLGVGILSPGAEVTVSFSFKEMSAAGGVVFAELFSEIAGGGTSKTEILGGAPLFGGPSYRTYQFTTTLGPDVSGGVTLQFAGATGAIQGSMASFTLDNVSITTVPEPGSLLLSATALAGLALRRRRAR